MTKIDFWITVGIGIGTYMVCSGLEALAYEPGGSAMVNAHRQEYLLRSSAPRPYAGRTFRTAPGIPSANAGAGLYSAPAFPYSGGNQPKYDDEWDYDEGPDPLLLELLEREEY